MKGKTKISCFNTLGACSCGGAIDPTSALLDADNKPILARFSRRRLVNEKGLNLQSEVMVANSDRRIMGGIPQFFEGACMSCCTHTEQDFSLTGKPFCQRVPMVFRGQELTIYYSKSYDEIQCQGPKCKPDLWEYLPCGFYYDSESLELLEHVPPTRVVTPSNVNELDVDISEPLGTFVPKHVIPQTEWLKRFFDPSDHRVRVCPDFAQAKKMGLKGLKKTPSEYRDFLAPNLSFQGSDREWDFLLNQGL